MKYLSKYKLFATKAQLNEAIRKQVYANNFSLTKSARAVFTIIGRHSIKYGAAHMTAQYIAKMIGKSIKTARRAINLLVSLGMIEKVETIRPKSGGDGANIFRVLPVKNKNDHAKMTMRENDEKPTAAMDEAPKTESKAINNLSYKDIILKDTYSEEPKPLKVTFYSKFKSFVHSTIGQDQKTVSKLYGVYLAHSNVLTKHGAFDKQDIENVGYEALRTAIMSTKTKRIKNIAGWFNGVLDKKLTQFIHEEAEAALEMENALTELEASFKKS